MSLNNDIMIILTLKRWVLFLYNYINNNVIAGPIYIWYCRRFRVNSLNNYNNCILNII